jgi:TRAP-type C4-dicarboxylate transport system permease small subunit
MTTLTLVLALILTAGIVLLTSAVASRYGINDESFFFED